ncbi:substrate-binding domain-containing protein [Bradyrhizobium sp.]|uniref:substrate-binding domain-containing protein n=1 Tax=Bradyrhizobium sp. TaxID=376 RepID=UPI002D6DABAA|nr:substrate-binding domain-containing protein [Bradyrhizobium sp.]HZR74764.1 substrate-binding domain-containing protein [Bradyrhizobium sp.]
MKKRIVAVLVTCLATSFAASPGNAMEKLVVMMSGGFSLAYRQVLPEFERATGIAVTTLSGASQGTGPKTIKSQLEQGAEVDMVILSKEGLGELIAAGRIAEGSTVDLASVPVGAAVRQRAPKPDVASVDALKQTLLSAHLVAMGASTSGIFMKDVVLPKLGIADKVSLKMVQRGTDSTAMLAAGEADLVIGPVSELIGQPGVELAGVLPDAVQLIQPFAAAVIKTAHNPDQAKKLIAFLASGQTTAAIKNSGMQPLGGRK